MFAAIVYGWSLGELAIMVVVLAAVCALVFVALRQFGIAVPGWVVQVGWILVVALVVILAIRFVMSL
jgi:hypothetical protein